MYLIHYLCLPLAWDWDMTSLRCLKTALLHRKHQGIWYTAPRYPFLPLMHSPQTRWALPSCRIFTKKPALNLLQSCFYSLQVRSSWPCMAPLFAHSSGQCARMILHPQLLQPGSVCSALPYPIPIHWVLELKSRLPDLSDPRSMNFHIW